MKKALSYTLIFLGIQLIASGLVVIVLKIINNQTIASSPYVNIGTMALFSIITAILFVARKWTEVSRSYLQSKPRMAIMWSVLAAFGAVVPSMALQEQLPELPNIVEAEMESIMNAHGGYFVIALLAPLTEEIVFRGAVLRALLKWKPNNHWAMIAISALLFALIHMNPAQMPHAFIIGLLLGWMFYRTDSIVPGVAFHWANNTIAFILFKLYPNEETHLIDILGTQRNVAAAVLFSLLILVPAIYQLHLWMKRPKTSSFSTILE